MSFDIQAGLGIFPQALQVHEKRAGLLASNLANLDTPHYKARDVDFRQLLTAIKQQQNSPSSIEVNHLAHFTNSDSIPTEYLKYRQPLQPSMDQNTVDSQLEQAEFAENSLRYMASLNFLTRRIESILSAIRGAR